MAGWSYTQIVAFSMTHYLISETIESVGFKRRVSRAGQSMDVNQFSEIEGLI
jgi:hypothetical protein